MCIVMGAALMQCFGRSPFWFWAGFLCSVSEGCLVQGAVVVIIKAIADDKGIVDDKGIAYDTGIADEPAG